MGISRLDVKNLVLAHWEYEYETHLDGLAMSPEHVHFNDRSIEYEFETRLQILRTRSEYPSARAATIASLSAADFTHSRVAVKVTVGKRIFSAIASTNDNIA